MEQKNKMKEQEYMKQLRKRVKEIRKPYVMKSKEGSLYIIYKGKVELYKLQKVETKKQIDEENPNACFDYQNVYGKGWNKQAEYEMAKENGFKQVGLKEVEEE